jgi:hypothetical protein
MAVGDGTMREGSAIASDLIAATERAAGSEKILWASRPDSAKTVSYGLRNEYWGAIFLLAFSVLWMFGATGFGTFPQTHSAFFYIFPLFGLPFLGMGILAVTAPWRDARRADRTVFALTDNRLIHVTSKSSGLTTQSIFPTNMLNIETTDSPDATGTIVITLSDTETWGDGRRNKRLPLIGVEDPATAMRLLDAMRAGRKA